MKKKFPIAVVVVFLLIFLSASHSFQTDSPEDTGPSDLSLNLTQEALAARFDHLSKQQTNSCGGGTDYVAQLSSDGKRIQGSCCGPMNLHSYEEQLEGLLVYADYDIIPSDPYDILAEWADVMIDYAERTVLDSTQQAVYEKAVDMSHEGGPCCCKCWHWYAYEGLAKHLIIHEGFSAEQIAEIWDLSDACGGEHAHH